MGAQSPQAKANRPAAAQLKIETESGADDNQLEPIDLDVASASIGAPEDLQISSEPPRPKDVGHPYDPSRERERNRTILAIGSFGLFAVVILTLLFASVFGREWSQLAQAASVLLPAVSAVSATALAFFFAGEKRKRKEPR